MLIQFQEYLTFENIYIWSTLGILPFWLMLIFVPNSIITRIFVNSIVIPLFLGTAYAFIIYMIIISEESLLEIFTLYSSLENLYTIYSSEGILLIFWLHFLALNFFLGSWISNDSIKFNISRTFTIIILIIAYFTGPLGLILYWFVRVFRAKKLSLHN